MGCNSCGCGGSCGCGNNWWWIIILILVWLWLTGGNHGSDRKGNGTFARKRRMMLHKKREPFGSLFCVGLA